MKDTAKKILNSALAKGKAHATRLTPKEDVEDLIMLCEADITTKNERKKKAYLKNFREVRKRLKQVEESDRIRNFQPPVDGQQIMEYFELSPGPEIGKIKEAIKEAILEGEIENEYEAAHEFMLKKGAELGLSSVN